MARSERRANRESDAHLEMENHVQLLAVERNGLDDFLWVSNSWHLAYREGFVLGEYLAYALQILVETGSACIVHVARLILLVVTSYWCIYITLVSVSSC